jgi:glyoxylase-like metal-dependent hydrolase (beta-lactamase superfamily II)
LSAGGGSNDKGPAVARSPDMSLTQDDSFLATSKAGLLYPWGDSGPVGGKVMRIAPGISWARIPMPGSLGHVNTWLLDDGDDLAIVDTGLSMAICLDGWKALMAEDLAGRRASRIICTHMHPDHIGLAGWLAEKYDAKIWMTRGEMLTARSILSNTSDIVPDEVIQQWSLAGWTEEQIEASKSSGWGRFGEAVHPLPRGYTRMVDQQVLNMGAHQWRVVIGSGHSPEHACLWNEKEGVLVSGDQVLPRISSNVSVSVMEPDADPLGEWLDSIDKLLTTIPADVITCPAHGEPFKGLHVRLRALRDEHRMRLYNLAEAIAEKPMRAVDSFSYLFNREITGEHLNLATGEALAHLKRLEVEGRVRPELEDGVIWYHPAA